MSDLKHQSLEQLYSSKRQCHQYINDLSSKLSGQRERAVWIDRYIKQKQKLLHLCVWRNGRVEITDSIRTEAICVAEGTREELERCLTSGCRLMKDNERWVVNGIPEAFTELEAENALEVFKLICINIAADDKAFEGVTELKLRQRNLDEAVATRVAEKEILWGRK